MLTAFSSARARDDDQEEKGSVGLSPVAKKKVEKNDVKTEDCRSSNSECKHLPKCLRLQRTTDDMRSQWKVTAAGRQAETSHVASADHWGHFWICKLAGSFISSPDTRTFQCFQSAAAGLTIQSQFELDIRVICGLRQTLVENSVVNHVTRYMTSIWSVEAIYTCLLHHIYFIGVTTVNMRQPFSLLNGP